MTTIEFKELKLRPAPVFSGGVGQPSLATIYVSHYDRLMAVVDAARSGNARLIRLALAECDKFGCSDEPPDVPPAGGAL